jgi:hypothetical protein
MFVALHHDDPVGFVNREIEPSEFFRTSVAKLDHSFAVRGVSGGAKKFEEPLLFPFPPLHTPLRVVSFEVSLQVAGLDESGLAVLNRTYIGADVAVPHRVTCQIYLNLERPTTARDIALERPLTGVDSCVFH